MSPLDWSLVILGSLLVGLAKGGVVGVGNLTVVLFAHVFEAKASVGLLLPVLIGADVVAVIVYRRHAEWMYLWRLLPWMLCGVIVGYFLFGMISDLLLRRIIGGLVLSMTLIQVWRMRAASMGHGDFANRIPHTLGFRASLGLLGGFATMVANAAGPIGQLYMISVGLPKMAFIGTSAWCFFLLNLFKLPFQANLGIINLDSLRVSLLLVPVAMFGALVAPRLVHYIPQKLFTFAVWFFILLAGAKLLLF